MGDRGRGRGGGRGRGRGFQKSDPDAPRISSTVQIFVEGLPLDAKLPEIQKYFESVGRIKCDRLTKKPRIWLYHDKGCSSFSVSYNEFRAMEVGV